MVNLSNEYAVVEVLQVEAECDVLRKVDISRDVLEARARTEDSDEHMRSMTCQEVGQLECARYQFSVDLKISKLVEKVKKKGYRNDAVAYSNPAESWGSSLNFAHGKVKTQSDSQLIVVELKFHFFDFKGLI